MLATEKIESACAKRLDRAARKVIASFAPEERASPEQALLERWSTPSVQPRTRMKGKSRPRRVTKGR